ncbi:MAG: TonB-dependent receptor [Chitinophagales bacterium]|nr:TonB-dependent receptor [Chitinophagales bacterium]
MKKLIFITMPFLVAAQEPDSIKTFNANEVLITSTRAALNTPTTFSLIKSAELQRVNLGQDLPVMLDFSPSVVSTSDAGAGVGYTSMRIRGSDATRINVTINGIPVNDAESHNVFWVNTPDLFSSVEDIQVQRGVGTSTNGAGAFGASVNIRTQKIAAKPSGIFAVSGGSFNTVKLTAQASSGLIKNKFFIEGRLSKLNSNGYVERASSNLWSYFVTTGMQHKSTVLKLVAFGGNEKTYQAWNGVSEDMLKTNRRFNSAGTDYGAKENPWRNEVDNYGQHYCQLLFSQGFKKGFSMNVGLFTTLGKGYYEQYKVNQKLKKYAPVFDTLLNASRTDVIRRRWLQNIFYGSTFSLSFERKNVNVYLGGLLSQYRGKHFGNIIWNDAGYDFSSNTHYYDNNSVKNDFNVYLRVSYTFAERVTLFADVQYRFVGYNGKGFDNDKVQIDFNSKWHFVNPKGGISVAATPLHHFYTSVAVGNKEPNRDDVAYNRAVKSERLIDWEGGYQFRHRKFPLYVNGYYMYYTNQLVLTGQLDDVGNAQRVNVPVSFRAGVELNGAIIFNSKISEREIFRIGYNLTYAQSKIKNFEQQTPTFDDDYNRIDTLLLVQHYANTRIAFSPDVIAGIELMGSPLPGLQLSLSTKAVSKQYLDNTQSEAKKLKPYSYTNFNAAYTFQFAKSRSVTVSVLVNNLFNYMFESNGYTYSERYYSAGTVGAPVVYNYYYPQAGINVLAGIRLKI